MSNVLEIEPEDADEAVALSYFSLLVRRDMIALERIWHEDAVQHIPFPPEGLGDFAPTSFVGREAIMDHYRAAFVNRRDHVFWIDHVHRTRDAGTIIVEAHARSILGETGAVYENNYVCVFTIRDGRITELREYANPLPAMRVFSPVFAQPPTSH
jgi:ketosteroid isomerase-like protein